MARAALGGSADGTVRALATYEARLTAIEVDVAEELFRATVPASEIGTAAMRTAARWYVARPRGWVGDKAGLIRGAAAGQA